MTKALDKNTLVMVLLPPPFSLSGLHGVLPVRGVIKGTINFIFYFYHLWRCEAFININFY